MRSVIVIALFLFACGSSKIIKSDEGLVPPPPQSYDECRDQAYDRFVRCDVADGHFCEVDLQAQINICKHAFDVSAEKEEQGE